jgi:hypothetical protein
MLHSVSRAVKHQNEDISSTFTLAASTLTQLLSTSYNAVVVRCEIRYGEAYFPKSSSKLVAA